MKIIYHCYGGTHSSVLAAAVHLGLIEGKTSLSNRELINCPFFDSLNQAQIGTINKMGEDNHENEIFVLGCKNAGSLVEKILPEFCRIFNIDKNNILMVSTIPCLNILLRIGGFLSRRAGLVTLGRFFLLLGARWAIKNIKLTVEEVKQKLLEKKETVPPGKGGES